MKPMVMEEVSGSMALVEDDYFVSQIRMSDLGIQGQWHLADSSVVVIGAGALGCPVASYLGMAGVGRILIVDGDKVERSNLHRQFAYRINDIGTSKASRLATFVKERIPFGEVLFNNQFVNNKNCLEIIGNYDLVIDCCDNFSSRYVIHDVAKELGIDLIQGSVQNFSGSLVTFRFSRNVSPCLRCLWPNPPQDGCVGSCGQDGVLGATTGVVASIMAQEALRHLAKIKSLSHARQVLFDLASQDSMKLTIPPLESCDCTQNEGMVKGDKPSLHSDENKASGIDYSSEEAERFQRYGQQLAEHYEKREIIDIRNSYEHQPQDGILFPDRCCIPMNEFLQSVNTLPRNKSLTIICEHGVRSEALYHHMLDLGFTDTDHIQGGFSRLRAEVNYVR